MSFPQGVSVLSAAAGAIVVVPDGVFSGEKTAIHHYFKELLAVCGGLPLRIGVTHGTVEFFEDVKGGTYIGEAINVSARVATALENRGLLYEKSYRDFRATSGDRDSFRPKAGDGIKVKGKSHDGDGFVCWETEEPLAVPKDFSGFHSPGHPPKVVSAFIVAVDLPRFSSGTNELLSKRFRAFVDAADKLLAENVVNELHYSPGGDGGIFVFPGVEPGYTARCILDWFDNELAEEAKHQTEAASVKSRIGPHHDLVQLYKDGEDCEVPTGLACLLAEQIAKDIAAGSIAYSEKLWKDGGRWFNKDSGAELTVPVNVPILVPCNVFS